MDNCSANVRVKAKVSISYIHRISEADFIVIVRYWQQRQEAMVETHEATDISWRPSGRCWENSLSRGMGVWLKPRTSKPGDRPAAVGRRRDGSLVEAMEI